jgi:hypothetical protein
MQPSDAAIAQAFREASSSGLTGITAEQFVLIVMQQAERGTQVNQGHLYAIEREALEGLLDVAFRAWRLADNTEETYEGRNVDSADYEALSNALDRLEALPDDQLGYTMSEAAKARWALRRLLGESE